MGLPHHMRCILQSETVVIYVEQKKYTKVEAYFRSKEIFLTYTMNLKILPAMVRLHDFNGMYSYQLDN